MPAAHGAHTDPTPYVPAEQLDEGVAVVALPEQLVAPDTVDPTQVEQNVEPIDPEYVPALQVVQTAAPLID